MALAYDGPDCGDKLAKLAATVNSLRSEERAHRVVAFEKLIAAHDGIGTIYPLPNGGLRKPEQIRARELGFTFPQIQLSHDGGVHKVTPEKQHQPPEKYIEAYAFLAPRQNHVQVQVQGSHILGTTEWFPCFHARRNRNGLTSGLRHVFRGNVKEQSSRIRNTETRPCRIIGNSPRRMSLQPPPSGRVC